jgi:hypothetical protein
MLAAGLLAAATVLTTVGVGAGSAGATVARQAGVRFGLCPVVTIRYVSHRGVNYFLGIPNIAHSGSAVVLKPRTNRTTVWRSCGTPVSGGRIFFSLKDGLVLTSRSSSPGADVTVTEAGNNGNGFASQQWIRTPLGSGVFMYRNMKTGLWLRVRNNGPKFYQTVTTGNTASAWHVS